MFLHLVMFKIEDQEGFYGFPNISINYPLWIHKLEPHTNCMTINSTILTLSKPMVCEQYYVYLMVNCNSLFNFSQYKCSNQIWVTNLYLLYNNKTFSLGQLFTYIILKEFCQTLDFCDPLS